MAKIIVSGGRILTVINNNAVFTALKELEGSEQILNQQRNLGKPVIKLPQSYVNDLAGRIFEYDPNKVENDLVSEYL